MIDDERRVLGRDDSIDFDYSPFDFTETFARPSERSRPTNHRNLGKAQRVTVLLQILSTPINDEIGVYLSR